MVVGAGAKELAGSPAVFVEVAHSPAGAVGAGFVSDALLQSILKASNPGSDPVAAYEMEKSWYGVAGVDQQQNRKLEPLCPGGHIGWVDFGIVTEVALLGAGEDDHRMHLVVVAGLDEVQKVCGVEVKES